MKKFMLFAGIIFSLLLLTSCAGTKPVQNTELWMNKMMDQALERVMAVYSEEELTFFSVVGTVEYQNASERSVDNPLTPADVPTWVFHYAYGDAEVGEPDVVEIDYENGTWREPFLNGQMAPTEKVLFNLPVHVSVDLDMAIDRAWNCDYQDWLDELSFIELSLPLGLREAKNITEPLYRFQRANSQSDFIFIGAFSGREHFITEDDLTVD